MLLIFLGFIALSGNAQKMALDPIAAGYFSKEQIDTMSNKFILVQNYMVRYSWNIQYRWDKHQDSVVVFSRDTIDIRPHLTGRDEEKPIYIYDIWPGLVLVLDSKEAIRQRINQIYSEN